jgi:hypothetical protein
MTQNFRVSGFVLGLAIKAPVKTTAVTNVVDLSGATQTINGYVTTAFDRVLLIAQTDPIDNGIYSVRVSAWVRDGDFDGNRDIVGGTIVPSYRSSDAEIVLYNVDGIPDAIEIGADPINFSVYFDPSVAGIPEAPIDGSAYVREDAGWVLEAAGSLPTPSISSVLAGDAAGTNWVIASNITLNATSGGLTMQGSFILADGSDGLQMSVNGALATFVGISGLQTIEIIPRLKLSLPIKIAERAAAEFDTAAYGQFWVLNEADNIPMFTSDDGTDQVIDPSRSDINLQNTSYTTVLSDKGKTIRKDAGGAGETFTIEAEATVDYKLGTLIGFDNDGGGDLTIAIAGADTLIWAEDGTTGSRTLADGGLAVAMKNAAGQWKISGDQLT